MAAGGAQDPLRFAEAALAHWAGSEAIPPHTLAAANLALDLAAEVAAAERDAARVLAAVPDARAAAIAPHVAGLLTADAGDARALVLAALEAEAALHPRPPVGLPPVPSFGGPSEALDALARVHMGRSLEGTARLDALEPAVADALTRILEAHLFQVSATRLAYATGPPGAELDLGLLLAARGVVAQAVLEAAPLLRAQVGGPVFQECGVVALDFAGEDTTYPGDCDFPVLVDVGGNDTYLNNAGGASLQSDRFGGYLASAYRTVRDRCLGADSGCVFEMPPCAQGETPPFRVEEDVAGCPVPVALLVDVFGDDVYAGTFREPHLPGGEEDVVTGRLAAWKAARGVNGGAAGGSAFLFDLNGEDAYLADLGAGGLTRGAGNGGAYGGVGFLADLCLDTRVPCGNEAYVGVAPFGGVNGGVYAQGAGLLLDQGGDDAYRGTVTHDGGVNGGASSGIAALVDLGGNDDYNGTLGDAGALNGASLGGVGLLVDRAGADRYDGHLGGPGGVNGASRVGLGVLLDGDGGSTFLGHAPLGAVNGAARGRTLNVTIPSITLGGYPIPYPWLVPIPPVHVPLVGPVGGGYLPDPRAVLEEHGIPWVLPPLPEGVPPLPTDRYHNRTVGHGGGVGVLIAGPGDDRYHSNGTTQGAADLYGLGVLVDLGGHNTYVAGGEGGLAQGAGRHGSAGLLVDRGLRTDFRLLETATGQGAGRQGVGFLYRTHAEGMSTYHNDTGARAAAGSLAGAGVGLRLDRGFLEDPTDRPDLRCTGSDELAGEVGARYEVRVCDEDPSTRQDVLDPLDGRPIGRVSKPPVPCEGVLEVPCALVPSGWRRWLAADGFNGTVDGGLFIVSFRPDATTGGTFHGAKEILQHADETCAPMCTVADLEVAAK